MRGKKRKGKETSDNRKLLKGKLEVARSGMGFVTVEGHERDILIKQEHLRTGLDGDEVRVEIIKAAKNGRIEGRITEVVTRKQSEFSGRLEVKPHFAFLIPDKQNMQTDIFIPLHLLHDGKDGDKAIVKVVDWSEKAKNPIGEVTSILTNESANEAAMQGILVDAGFPLHFPDEVLEEAARFTDVIDPAELSIRRDLRGLLTMTIDPVDAKDFDDALSIKKLKGNSYEVGVHIADVSHFVEKDSPLDKEAYLRATSVYLPDRVLPMLPENLSNHLCSLRPDEDKYAFSAIFEISKAGKVKDFWLGKTVIRSQRRFSYEEVQEIIEGAEGDHKKEIMVLNEMAQNLRAARFKKGAINFSSQEIRFKLDDTGKPIGIVVKESKDAHKLIEEFMLLANRTVAKYVSEKEVKGKPVPFAYRVHDVPDESKLAIFAAFASRFGHKFNLNDPDSIAESFNAMLEEVKGKPQQHVLESLGIRTMSKAVYTTDNIGHYGLGFQDYCHFTSPIRRYPDVLVHRVLEECLENDIKQVKNMEQMCRHCSDQERNAMEAERAGNKYKQVEYISQFIGDEFDAIISGVSASGFWAETVAHKCEGMVSIADLSEFDDFSLIEGEYTLVGRHTGLRFQIGDKVKVKVMSANLDRRQIDYSLSEAPERPRKAKSRAAAPRNGKPSTDYKKHTSSRKNKK